MTRRAFTLIEMMISLSAIGIAGGIIFLVLNSGFVLFAKNTAMNVAHEQARVAILQMERNIHSAVSVPQLIDANLNAVVGSGPAAGVSFQVFAAGPYRIATDAAAAQSVVSLIIPAGSAAPAALQRLIIPTHQIEQDITAVSGAGTVNVTLANNLGVAVSTSNGTYDIISFITNRVSYVVVGGQLRYYPPGTAGTSNYAVLASDITNATPFAIPASLNNHFVAAVQLSAQDPAYSARGYLSSNMFINSQIPYKARMTTYQ